MNDIVHPIHKSAVGLANLRLFRSPLSGPQQPWHSQEDLFACLTLPRELRRHFTRSMKKDYGKDVRTVMTVDGPTTIAPHWAAQGFIGAMREVGYEPEGFEHAYVIAITKAMNVLTDGMSPEDSLNYTLAAFRNSNKIPWPHPRIEMVRPDCFGFDDGETLQ